MKNKIVILGDQTGKLTKVFNKFTNTRENEIIDLSHLSVNRSIREISNLQGNSFKNIPNIVIVNTRNNTSESFKVEEKRLRERSIEIPEVLLYHKFGRIPQIYFGTSGRVLSSYKGREILEEVTGHEDTTHSITDINGNNYNVNSDHTELINPFPLGKEEVIGWSTYFKSERYKGINSTKSLPIDFLECEIIKFSKRELFIEYNPIEQSEEANAVTFSHINNFINKSNQ